MADVVWPDSVLQVLLELPEEERAEIQRRARLLQDFPRIYPVRAKGRFRGHRWFAAGSWLVYYRVRANTVYIRAIWHAQVP